MRTTTVLMAVAVLMARETDAFGMMPCAGRGFAPSLRVAVAGRPSVRSASLRNIGVRMQQQTDESEQVKAVGQEEERGSFMGTKNFVS